MTHLRTILSRFVASILPDTVVYWAAVRLFTFHTDHASASLKLDEVRMLAALQFWFFRKIKRPLPKA